METIIEEWRPVVGYEGFYEVSNTGKVRSVTRCVFGRDGLVMTIKGRDKVQSKDRVGYLVVGLSVNNKYTLKLVHRLVADAFLKKPNGNHEINHIDGNKENNSVNNLEWCTHKQNMVHSAVSGLRTDCKRVKNLETGNIYYSIKEAARQTGIPESTISKWAKRKKNMWVFADL